MEWWSDVLKPNTPILHFSITPIPLPQEFGAPFLFGGIFDYNDVTGKSRFSGWPMW